LSESQAAKALPKEEGVDALNELALMSISSSLASNLFTIDRTLRRIVMDITRDGLPYRFCA
jgi:hypothetical protein